MTKRKSLRELARRTPVGSTARRTTSVVDTLPGLAEDLAATIADQRAKPEADRHSIKAIYEMACEAFPELKDRLTYNGFWKHVTSRFNYHGSATAREGS